MATLRPDMQNWRSTIYTILIAIVLGGAAGILGTAWTSSYLSDYAVQLSELTSPLRLSQERPRNFPSSYKEALERFVEASLPSVVEIYQGTPGVLGFNESDRIHSGLMLTSDGWLAISVSAPAALKGSSVRIRGEIYPVVETVYDSTTKIIFAKVDANGLPIAAFGKGRDSHIGEQVFIAITNKKMIPSSIAAHVVPGTTPISSDEPNRRLILDRETSTGSIVFNLSGDAIGFLQSETSVLPIEAVLPALRSMLEQQKIVRPSFGVQYIDLSHALNVSPNLRGSHRTGALLYGSSSIARGGAAKLAGLRASDILLSINGESIDDAHGLDELIEQYRSGDVVQVLIERARETQTIEVKLGEKKE